MILNNIRVRIRVNLFSTIRGILLWYQKFSRIKFHRQIMMVFNKRLLIQSDGLKNTQGEFYSGKRKERLQKYEQLSVEKYLK